jgi:catechol 2,3-dioxygenase-like lactoylglutathione lyase family enzyme
MDKTLAAGRRLDDPQHTHKKENRSMLSDFPISPTLPVSDLARARTFYEEVLGFQPSEVIEETGQVTYPSGGGIFLIYATGSAGTNQATSAGWTVDDLDAEMADLRSRGVVFEEYDLPGLKTVNGVVQLPDARAAWFKDTEGNILALNQLT